MSEQVRSTIRTALIEAESRRSLTASKVACFREIFPSDPATAEPLPTFSWEMLERQLLDLRGPNCTEAHICWLIETLRGRLALMPPELLLREILLHAWTILDEQPAQMELDEHGEAPMP